MIFLVATVIVALVIARIIAKYVLSGVGITSRHRHTVLLIGLCGSGKTTLFAQLIAQKRITTRTSMKPNRAVMTLRSKHSITNNGEHNFSADNESTRTVSTTTTTATTTTVGSPVEVVDYPGHRRLRESLTSDLEEANKVVLVVDSVTIQDDRQEGAQALAELVVSVFTSPAFYGVKRVLVACTKRDELTSYSAKAVKRILEAEVTRCLATRRGEVQSLDSIVNASGLAVGRRKNKSGGGVSNSNSSSSRVGKVHELLLGESGKFTFDDFPIPVVFVDVSSYVLPTEHPFNVEVVREFVDEKL
ncbi:Signal recognition particle receptor [Trypanosoma melophagium]|uniref:Signal recognition particle receptor n=1 Tax=Trypanosoma melophagium TaxID=715481 RepID=UPI00351A0925|nr:Signal recognition particle receptor [Trypanosoma melophagium]